MIDLNQYKKSGMPWVDAIIKELEEARLKTETITEARNLENAMGTRTIKQLQHHVKQAQDKHDAILKELEEAQLKNAKLQCVCDFLTKSEDGNKVVGFSKSGALRNLHKAMHLARIAQDPKSSIDKLNGYVKENIEG